MTEHPALPPDGPVHLAYQTVITDGKLKIISEISPRLSITKGLSKESLEKAHVIYAGSAEFRMEDVPNLQWFQSDSVAVENLMNQPLGQSGIPIANVRGAYTMAVAELAIGLMLTLTRSIQVGKELQLKREWNVPAVCGENCYGKTMGIVGYGNIGRQIARIASAMGMKVLACGNRLERKDPSLHFPNTGDPEGNIPEAWYHHSQMAEMFKLTDVVVIVLPSTPDTRQLVGKSELSALPGHALVINVGRGNVMDEGALLELLQSGKIAGAGLDVFETEPPASDHPFWKMSNVVMMPHVASYTSDQLVLASDILIENLSRYLTNRPLVNLVEPSRGY
jgi:phosphoglycerate dehydrogenase-like enzyme